MELLLNARGVAAAQAALVDISDPGDVRLEVGNILLEGHDVLVGDDLGLDTLVSRRGSGEGSGNRSQEEGKAAKIDHGEGKSEKAGLRGLELMQMRISRPQGDIKASYIDIGTYLPTLHVSSHTCT